MLERLEAYGKTNRGGVRRPTPEVASKLGEKRSRSPVPSVRDTSVETLIADPIDNENTRKLALFGGIRANRPTERPTSETSPKGL